MKRADAYPSPPLLIAGVSAETPGSAAQRPPPLASPAGDERRGLAPSSLVQKEEGLREEHGSARQIARGPLCGAARRFRRNARDRKGRWRTNAKRRGCRHGAGEDILQPVSRSCTTPTTPQSGPAALPAPLTQGSQAPRGTGASPSREPSPAGDGGFSFAGAKPCGGREDCASCSKNRFLRNFAPDACPGRFCS